MKSKPPILMLLLSLAGAAFAAPLGNAFVYQGRLDQSGSPAMGIYDFRFELFDSATGNGTVGSPLTVPVPVTNGLFAVSLDFGTGVFTGPARWLAIEVKTNDPGGALPYSLLTPRQELAPTPYALHAADAGTVDWNAIAGLPAGFADGVDNDTLYTAGKGLTLSGLKFEVIYGGDGTASSVSHSDHTHFGQTWTGAAPIGLSITNQSGGLGSTAIGGEIPASSAALYSIAVQGVNRTSSGYSYGVFGEDDGAGTGVAGVALNGRGVYGVSGTQTGVEGVSADGPGVVGRNTSTTTTNAGVTGQTLSEQNAAAGVLGVLQAGSGGLFSAGVRGVSEAISPASFGVYGTNAHTGAGVGGMAAAGTGVWGWSSTGTGVRGGSTTGTGVWGYNTAGGLVAVSPTTDALGNGAGVEGYTASEAYDAVGVRGEIYAFNPGAKSAGVLGLNSASGVNGAGVIGRHLGSGIGVYGESASGEAIYGNGHVSGVRGLGVGAGVVGESTIGAGVSGEATSAGGVGVRASAASVTDIALEITTGGLKVRNAGIGTSTPVFIQKVTAGNIGGGGLQDWTIINHPLCNNDPNAILIVTANYNPGNTGFIADANPLGVNYDSSTGRWSIFHPNGAAMVVGAAYNVLIFKP